MRGRILVAVLVAAQLSACGVRFAERAPQGAAKAERDRVTLSQVQAAGLDGDWLVIRGYHVTDNLVAKLTAAPLSHAAVLDRANQQVIEADATGIHATSLAAFVEKSHRLLLIRPQWRNDDSGAAAAQTARGLVGRKYDFLGLIGVDVPDRYYCSELALAVYKALLPAGMVIPRPLEPAQMYFYGTILYDSGPI